MFTMEGKSFPMGELPQIIREKQLKQFAIDIVKYQKFRPYIAVEKINSSYTTNTKNVYFKAGIDYINDKIRSEKVTQQLYDYIDEAIKSCVQPLTPSPREKRVIYNYKNKPVKVASIESSEELPVVKVLNQIKNEKPKTYGVMLGNNIALQNSKDDIKAFIAGIKFLNPASNPVLVEIEIKEVEEDD